MDVPLTVAAVVFLVAYSWEVIANLEGAAAITMETIIAVTWVVFLIDYVVNLVLAVHRWRWFYRHLFDLAVVVLPMLRPLRLLRLITLLGVLQRRAGSAIRSSVLVYVGGATVLLIYVAGLAVLDAERTAIGTQVTSLGDGIWWAFVTITTVGYGDIFPVTTLGRVIAAGVMIAGIGLIGVVTATLASWIVERVASEEEQQQAATRQQVADLAREISELKHAILKQQ